VSQSALVKKKDANLPLSDSLGVLARPESEVTNDHAKFLIGDILAVLFGLLADRGENLGTVDFLLPSAVMEARANSS